MHMADALISPAVGAGFWAGTLIFISYCARRLNKEFNEKLVPLMGIMGAFIFAGQMINFTIPGTGSSGHIGGGLLLAIVLGPHAAFLTIASVLMIQALFFADGGLLALGCNIWNLGIYPCFIAYPLIYKTIAGDSSSNKKITTASILGGVLGLELGALSVVLETIFSGITDLPFSTFAGAMLPIHLAIGLVEGMVTAAVIIYVKNIQPELVYNNVQNTVIPLKKLILSISILAIITGGLVSWFASTHPDGLEWSIAKLTGKEEPSGKDSSLHKISSAVQEKTSILPDYSFKVRSQDVQEDEKWPAVSTGTSASGIVGGLFTLSVILLIGGIIKLCRSTR